MRPNSRHSRWAIVGNDYVFPRDRDNGCHLPAGTASDRQRDLRSLGTTNFSRVLEELRRDNVDGVIMLPWAGRRAFQPAVRPARLDEQLVRLSPAVEENTLLGGRPNAHEEPVRRRCLLRRDGHVERRARTCSTTAAGPPAPAQRGRESCYEASTSWAAWQDAGASTSRRWR